METRHDYHIQIDVRSVGGANLHHRMIESWAMAFTAVGIPFLLPAARMQTVAGNCHQLIYGVSGMQSKLPDAAKLRSALRESLLVHDFKTAKIDVIIYVVSREVVSADLEPQEWGSYNTMAA